MNKISSLGSLISMNNNNNTYNIDTSSNVVNYEKYGLGSLANKHKEDRVKNTNNTAINSNFNNYKLKTINKTGNKKKEIFEINYITNTISKNKNYNSGHSKLHTNISSNISNNEVISTRNTERNLGNTGHILYPNNKGNAGSNCFTGLLSNQNYPNTSYSTQDFFSKLTQNFDNKGCLSKEAKLLKEIDSYS